MANVYPGKRPLYDKYLPAGQLVDISTPSISYAPIPSQGVIQNVLCVISAAITVADSVVTVKVIQRSGGTITLGTITVATAGSAAGSFFSIVFSGSVPARSVVYGDVLVCDSDGGSTTTSIANFTAVIREE